MMFRKSLIMSITELENSMMTKKGKKIHVPKQNHIIRTRGVQKNRITEKTEKTDEKLTEKTEPR